MTQLDTYRVTFQHLLECELFLTASSREEAVAKAQEINIDYTVPVNINEAVESYNNYEANIHWTESDDSVSKPFGWVVSNGPDELPQIQRYDDMDYFASDTECWYFVTAMADAANGNNPTAKKALRIIEQQNPKHYEEVLNVRSK